MIGSISSSVADFCSEFVGAHQQLGSSISTRIGGVFSSSVTSQSGRPSSRDASPIIAALCMQMISNKSLRDQETMEHHIQRMVDQGNFQWLALKKLNIRLSSIVKDPDLVLEKLVAYIDANPNKSLNVTFLDEQGKPMPGIDAGGLSRQLIGDLFQEIPRSKKIKFERLENNRLRPVLKDGLVEDLAWKHIGKVINYCLQKDNLLIGDVFEDSFYEALMLFAQRNINVFDFNALLPIYEILFKDDEAEIGMINRFKNLLNKESWSHDDYEMAYAMVDLEETGVRNAATIHADLRAVMVAMFTPKMIKYLTPLRLIKNECTDARLCAFQTSQLLCIKLQGRIDKSFVLSKIDFSDSHPNESYLKRWISESTDDELKAFIKAVTGASAVGNIPMRVTKSGGSMVVFHTCSRQMDLPTQSYQEYIAFKAMLTLSIEYGLAGGFQTI